MLSHKVLTRQDVGRTASYYEDSADDYYAKEGESKEWQGQGAERLGLSGDVDSARLRALMSGQVSPGVQISRASTRHDSNARIGIDLTFSAPKSVSLQALVHGDPEIIKAHDRAVTKAIEVAEQMVQTRQKVNGKSRVESTGNLIAAKFRHETSRERDPQLHTHAVIMNLTQRSDGQWRALRNDEIIKSVKHLGAEYQTHLARELKGLGYEIRHERDGLFDLAHISREQLEQFSQRSSQIEGKLAEQGKTRATASTAEKQLATMQTRAAKTATERSELFQEWKARAAELHIDFDRREWTGSGQGTGSGRRSQVDSSRPPLELNVKEASKRAVKFAISHHTERQSVVSHKALVTTAMSHGVGRVGLADVEREIRRQRSSGHLIKDEERFTTADQAKGDDIPRSRQEWEAVLVDKGMEKGQARARIDAAVHNGGLVRAESRYTTQVHIEREKRILQIERDGRGAMPQAMTPEAARERLSKSALNTGQRESAELMVTTQDRVVGVQGSAGVGKSYMVNTAKPMLEERGYRVIALAPYASQVKALRSEGVEARTVASFLRARDKGLDERTVVVLDEAGVIPTRQMDQTLRLIEKAGARTVLLGDIEQTKAVEAGRPFDQLQKAGMNTAFMKEIRRQQNPDLRLAVEMAAEGRAGESVPKITAVHEVKDDKERYQALAEAYIQHPQMARDETIIVTGTNEARREVNQRVRSGLELEGKGYVHDAMVRQDTTQAERRYSSNYKVGWYIQPERDYDKVGLKRAELYKVLDTGPGNYLTVEGKGGDPIRFSPARQSRLSAYAMERVELAPGDTIRINRHGAHLDLDNGDRFRVGEVTENKVTLTSESRKVELATDKPLHLDYAYATTVHSSQGLTADRVLIDAKTSSRTTSRDVYYVAISRARHEASMFTNDARKIADAVQRENPKYAALDIAGHPTPGKQRELGQESGARSTEKEGERLDYENAGQGHRIKHGEQQRDREAAHERDFS